MDKSQSIARLAGPVFCVIALGVLANLNVYREVAAQFIATPYLIYLTGVLVLTAGLAILNAHPHWTRDWRSLVTLVGWLLTIGGVWRVFAPNLVHFVGLAALANTGFLVGAGIVFLLLGGFLTYKGYTA
ncbi:MAG: hypothetical protein JO205_06250 [Pseudolabrys sp.]|nr:hypothetical protein [Pseudolabrys sp.]MBV9260957.1 hypothetical protein [Pseudolabrys sp.]